MADQRAIVTRFLEEVWNEGRLDAIPSYLGERYTIYSDPGDPWDGQTLDVAGFRERVRQSRAPFPDQRFTVTDLVAEPDKIAVTWTWTGMQTGELAGFPASGRRITMSGITVYYFDGDRIVGHRQVVDRLGVYQQLQGSPRQ